MAGTDPPPGPAGTPGIVGVDARTYPADPGSAMGYTPAFAALPARHPVPAPLPPTAVDEFLAEATKSYPAQFI
jgi:hypothetical protein